MTSRIPTWAGRLGLGTVLALVLAASAVLVASASGGPRDLTIACARKSDGVLRYVVSASRCHRRTERAVHVDASRPVHACVQQFPATARDPDADGDNDLRPHGVVLAGARDTDPVHAAGTRPARIGTTWLVHSVARCLRARQRPLMLPQTRRTYFCAAGHAGWLRYVGRLSHCRRSELELIVESSHVGGSTSGNSSNGNGPNGNGSPGNTPPTARDDSGTTDEKHAVNVNVLGNDTDPSTHPLQVASLDTTGTKGHVTVNADNTIRYDPNGQFNSLQAGQTATDRFKYTASDGHLTSAPATVTVTITGVNDPPVLSGIESGALAYTAGQSEQVTSTLTAGDVDDANLSGATVAITSGFALGEDHLVFTNQNGISGSYDSFSGVLTLSGTASVANYQAALRSIGYEDTNATSPSTATRTISFQVSDPHGAASNTASRHVSVTPNTPPTANDDGTSTGKHTATDISVLSNDSDADGDALHVASVDTTGTKGSVTVNPDNTIRYDPNGQFDSLQAGQTATDTFKYKASDGFSDSNSATVTVTIDGSNDAPVVSGIESSAASYQAGSAATPISSSLAVSDDDDANLSGATVSITSGFASGEDQLGFVNQNGITGSYDSSTGVLTLSGTASVADYQTALRSVTYSNPNGASASTATRTIAFQVTDPHAAASNTESRNVTVTRNPPPTANDDTASTDSLTATDINVLGNDSDSDGDTLQVASVDTTGTKGSVSINGDNTIHYDPNGQFDSLAKGATATDTFKYKANDGFSDSNSATVTVTVTGANHPPTLANIESTTLSGYRAQDPAVAITSSLTASDSDNTNLASATVSITSGFVSTSDQLHFTNQNGISGSYDSTSGVLTLTGSASVADYQAALRSVTFSNSSSATTTTSRTITFQADDGESNNHASNTQSRDISVGPANQAPTAGTDSYSAVGNTTLGVGTSPSGPAVTQSGSVLSNDSDPDSADSLTVTPGTITTAQGGSVTMNSDGTFTYLPAQGFSGADSFNYTVNDSDDPSNPKSSTGTVDISVGTLVWYVDNSKVAAGDGRSTSPFNTLAAANAKVGSGDVMFLYQGSGNYTGGTTMKSNEQLIGQPNGLTVSGHALVAAGGSNPTITNSSGDGIDLASGTTIRRVDVSSPSGAGISGTGISTADIGSSMSISGASGSSFKLSGGSGNVTMGASITNTAGHSVDISGRTGGTTTLSGDISDSGTGVLLSTNTGATTGFTGKITNSTGANQAFTATGGGTVSATGSGSTLTSTTGTALDVANTAIGTGGLNFQAISANGAANGIVLNSTGTTAGLTVSGTGSAGSGGTIQNTTGDAVSLATTSSPSFNEMNITSPQHKGVNGTAVHGFSYTNGSISGAGAAQNQQTDAALAFNNNSPASTNDNLDGAVTITGDTISNPYGSGVDILNFNGTISDANISSNTISSTTSTTTSKGSAIALNLFGNATTVPNLTKAEIESNSITNFPSGYGINVQGGNNTSGTAPSGTYGTPGTTNAVQISGNLANGTYTGGKCLPGNGACMGLAAINANVTGRGQGNFNISNNGTAAHPLGRSVGSPFQTGAAGSVTANFAIENNVVSAFNAGGGDGIGLGVDKNQQADSTVLSNPSVKATITGNQVSNYDGGGVHFIQLDSNGSSNLKMDSNTTSSPESDNQAGAGIEVDEGSSGSASYNPTLCSEIKSNTAAAGNANSFGDTVPGIVITKESTSSSTYSFGIVGLSPSPANESQTQSYLAGQNPASAAGGGFYAGTTVFANPGDQWTSCTLPTMP